METIEIKEKNLKIGQHVYCEIDKNAFFKIIDINKLGIYLKQCDNLAKYGSEKKEIIFIVNNNKIKFYNDYIN